MKIISGKYKGRNILGYDIDGTRPTMERVKESLFAMIQDYINSAVCLDLFSGSGNLGIEALSEGAKYAYLVDKNYKACSVINKNLETLNIQDASVLNMDFKKAIAHFKENNIKFNIIFLDPPYKTNYIEESIKLIEEYDLLEKNGLIVCENEDINKIVYSDKYKAIKSKKYGDKWVVILK